MKLDAGNPNTRANRNQPVYVHVPRDPNVVPAPAINIWEQPVYKSAPAEYVRPGADDHLKIKSKGNQT